MMAPGSAAMFQSLLDDPDRVRELLAGSCYFDATFAEWEHGRRFIADLILRDGTILDIGCGNGFLLRCLQKWTSRTLEPFGIDTDRDRLAAAQALFPDQSHRFIICDAADFAAGTYQADVIGIYPPFFDTIFWNVWDNARFTDKRIRDILTGLIARLAPGWTSHSRLLSAVTVEEP